MNLWGPEAREPAFTLAIVNPDPQVKLRKETCDPNSASQEDGLNNGHIGLDNGEAKGENFFPV